MNSADGSIGEYRSCNTNFGVLFRNINDRFDPLFYTTGATFDASTRQINNNLLVPTPGRSEITPVLAESWTRPADDWEYT